MSGGGARSRPEGRPGVHLTASLGNDPVSSAAAAAAEDYDGWARDRTADGGHALAGKWPRRPMGALLALALAPNPIDTRALATRALATAPESAGIGDMQGKATPGLGALGGGIAAAGQNAAAAKEAAKKKAEEDAAYAEHDAEKTQTERSAEDQGKREAAEAARAANHYWGNPKELARHYAEHGEGVGATSKEEYADMAHELYLNKDSTR